MPDGFEFFVCQNPHTSYIARYSDEQAGVFVS